MHKTQIFQQTGQPGVAVEICNIQLGRKEVLEMRESDTLPLVVFSW